MALQALGVAGLAQVQVGIEDSDATSLRASEEKKARRSRRGRTKDEAPKGEEVERKHPLLN